MAFATINKGSSYFNTVTYTGTGTTNNVTGVGFKPDFTWIKDRSNARDNQLVNGVVGYPSGTLISNTNDAEYTAFPRVDSSNADGFTVSTPTQVNGSGETYVAWNWLSSNSTTTNTVGSISSVVSVNTTAGISIGTFTGTGSNATIGHGLGSVPKYLWVKNRTSAGDWMVYHQSTGNTYALFYNSSSAGATSSTYWQNTTPTSSVFSIGTNANLNTNGNSHLFVAFSEIKGYSKFGSYTGNGNANGTFVYTGFKPAYVMFKYVGPSEGWAIFDDVRNTYNPESLYLYANLSNVEGTETGGVDFLSNGFKIRNSFGYTNNSGGTYIYSAFAENPFVLTDGTPVTAR